MVNSNLYNNIFNIRKNKYNSLFTNLIDGGSKIGLFELLNKKKDLFIKIFGLLFIELIITYIFAFNIRINFIENNPISIFIFGLLSFILIIILAIIPMPIWLKLIVFTLYSIIIGLFLSTLKYTVSSDIIKTAIIGTLSIFLFMFIIGILLYYFEVYLSNIFGIFLIILLLIMIIVIIVLTLMDKYNIYNKLIAIILLIIFGIYIIYDTNRILQDYKYYENDFVTASIDYYLDIINIFINLIILNNR